MEYYRRNLPHWQPKGAEFFITFRLAGSLPKEVIELLKEKRRQFGLRKKKGVDLSWEEDKVFEERIFKIFDHYLDTHSFGPVWLSNSNIARIVADSLHFYDQKKYDLYAYCIMSNHVHVVFKHLEEKFDVDMPATEIMKLIKSYTGKESNKVLNRSGQFWQNESFDRFIRDDGEHENMVLYTINNPVKVNLVSSWEDWPNTYCKSEFIESV